MGTTDKYSECIALLEANKNLILTGAPGTGKTYLAREIAETIAKEKPTNSSDNTSDFTELIKKHIKPNMDVESSKGRTNYHVEQIKYSHVILSGSSIQGYPIPFSEIEKAYRTKLWEGGQRNGYDPYSAALAKYIFENKQKSNLSNIKNVSKHTFIQFVQFHPSYDYTDFVEGLRPIYKNGNIGFERKDGVFKEFCKKAIAKSSDYFVFIIDEINRGEISKIFGELFFSIDPSYRGKSGRVKTQYQNMITDEHDPFYEGFYVPENVYIIGTMNDIDRSVESMDFAMRRRFAWKEIKANENTGMLDSFGGLKNEIISKMNRLNNAIWNEETNEGIEGLSAAYHIGGAYFKKLELYDYENNLPEAYRQLWENHLRGVLFEYLRGSFNAADNLKKLEEVYYSKGRYE